MYELTFSTALFILMGQRSWPLNAKNSKKPNMYSAIFTLPNTETAETISSGMNNLTSLSLYPIEFIE